MNDALSPEDIRHLDAVADFDISLPQKYVVFYPSGASFAVTGIYRLVDMGADVGRVPFLEVSPKQDLALDARCVVARAGNAFLGDLSKQSVPAVFIVYSPRQSDARLGVGLLEWLADNPDWPFSVLAKMGKLAQRS